MMRLLLCDIVCYGVCSVLSDSVLLSRFVLVQRMGEASEQPFPES